MNAQPNLGIEVTTFENPMGVDGFEFVEFAAPDARAAACAVPQARLHGRGQAQHEERSRSIARASATSSSTKSPARSPPSSPPSTARRACGFAIRFSKPAAWVREQALKNGGEPIASTRKTRKAVDAPVINGIGDCMLYLIDRYGAKGDIYDGRRSTICPAWTAIPKGFGLTFIDHLTHNLYFGNMAKWSDYYERLFNFREIRYFDIKGAKTGLVSKAMTAPDGIVRIPLNESSDPKSQINEYLDAVPRRRHPAHRLLHRHDLRDGRSDARSRRRVPRHAGPTTKSSTCACRTTARTCRACKQNKILIDADKETKQRKLLQIFTQNCIGPIFFEIIQRKGNEGFGEGNFQALFESIERDQMRRGVL